MGSTETDQCPFAVNPDMTGCDCDCELPGLQASGFWARLRRFFVPSTCSSGSGGCGNGRLPCPRYSEWCERTKGAGNG